MSDFTPSVVPYDYRPARFVHPTLKGYWVKLYCLFDGKAVYTFLTATAQIENGCLINEISGPGSSSLFDKEILVTPSQHSDIYNEIVAFEEMKKQCV